MRKIGDIISWKTNSGTATGEIVRIDVRYTVIIEPDRKRHMVISESETLSKITDQ